MRIIGGIIFAACVLISVYYFGIFGMIACMLGLIAVSINTRRD